MIVGSRLFCYALTMENKIIMSRDPSYFDSYDNECFCPDYDMEVMDYVGKVQPESNEKERGGLYR